MGNKFKDINLAFTVLKDNIKFAKQDYDEGCKELTITRLKSAKKQITFICKLIEEELTCPKK